MLFEVHTKRIRVTTQAIRFTVQGSRLKAMKKGLYSLDKYPVHPVF
jgi:hypothetical protein